MGDAALEVVAGALIDAGDRVLIAQRPVGRARAGRWELPGGKREDDEPALTTLTRELKEELGIAVGRARPLLTCRYRYPGESRDVRIEAWRVESWTGEPTALDGQALRWCPREELPDADLLEADRPIVTALWLPRLFVHIPSAEALDQGLARARGRIGWLVDDCPPAPLLSAAVLAGHWLGVIDPKGQLPDAVSAVYSPAALVAGGTMTGALAYTWRDAHRAYERGAAYLFLPDSRPSAEVLAAVAALGLPYYPNAAGPGRGARARAPTGRLWWPRGRSA